jgi:light-regulated signal transduction histidine kinase (bacteriophytochrome)
VIVDMTERHRAEQESERLRIELERSNEDLSRFSYALAHDIHGPANNVRALGELLKNGKAGALNEKQVEVIGMITDTAATIQRLVSSMLEFAQVGHGEIKREEIAVNDIIDAVRTRLSAAIADSGATIQYDALPVIEADRTQLEQVFQNLLSNAIEYRKPGEALVISISGESLAGEWTFSIEDNGEGIPPEYLHRIFEPLKRLHGKDVPGTGLGLALCRRILERHNGRIWAESAGPGSGATIRFVLPRPAPIQ